MRLLRSLLSIVATLGLASCVTTPTRAPSAETQQRQIFVVAANPLAADAGMAVLRRGGSAIDAAIAVQAMLSLVEPQSSGVGGGAFLNHYDGSTRQLTIYDGRETAPAGATEGMFLDASGRALPFPEAVVSGRATGVPGVLKMLAVVHEERGKLPWNQLFGDSVRVAEQGFLVTPRLSRFVNGNFPQASAPDVRTYFTEEDGTLVDVGDRLRNPAYADFLRRLAAQGPDAMYRGPTAERIVTRTRAGPLGGSMTLADLQAYRPVKREPLCRTYRVHLLCVPPPPSSGVGFLQLMAILERTDVANRGPNDPQAWFLFAEASRIMFADRDRYVGDVPVPVQGLLDPAYVATRAALIGERAGPPPVAGEPRGAVMAAADRTLEPAGTTHFIVGDADGNVISMTSTVESLFGSGRMVDGFFLNNQMTDFALQPRDAAGRVSVNAVSPGKRPRSSMTPLIVLDADRNFVGALGSAGGNAILPYVGKSFIGAFDWNLSMGEALALPNLVARGTNFNGEANKMPAQVLEGLRARGIEVRPGQGEDSGLTGVRIRNGRFDGGADPRREGVARVESVR